MSIMEDITINSLQGDTGNTEIDLSFIIATRNDNYGSNPILRLRLTLQNILLYPWKSSHNISTEVIIIEWNPVSFKPHIWEYPELNQLLKLKHNVTINIYSIPPYYHKRINPNPLVFCPFYEYHAKNVGLRRSNGQWKMIMNIDDLWGQNLLNLIAISIKHKSLDTNGIYQAWKNKIYIENMTNYINKSIVFPVEDILNIPVFQHDNLNRKCLWYPPNTTQWAAGGDFIFIHNHSLYKYFGGGFLESSWNNDIDSEFIQRQIRVNRLRSYYIQWKCSYFHIEHLFQKYKRKEYSKFNEYDKNKTTAPIWFTCDGSGYPYQYIRDYNQLPNGTKWQQMYENGDKHWGIKDVQFNVTKF